MNTWRTLFNFVNVLLVQITCLHLLFEEHVLATQFLDSKCVVFTELYKFPVFKKELILLVRTLGFFSWRFDLAGSEIKQLAFGSQEAPSYTEI